MIQISFYYIQKISIFAKGLTYDTGKKFQISFEPTFL